MQASEIKKLIARGESENVELKKSLRSESDALKTAAAFANADGGWILFGVKDNGEIVGVDIGVNTLENLANAFHRQTDPIIYPTVRTVQIENRTVIAVRVPAGSDKPKVVLIN